MNLLCLLGLHKLNKSRIDDFKRRRPHENEIIHCERCKTEFRLHWNWYKDRFGVIRKLTKEKDNDAVA